MHHPYHRSCWISEGEETDLSPAVARDLREARPACPGPMSWRHSRPTCRPGSSPAQAAAEPGRCHDPSRYAAPGAAEGHGLAAWYLAAVFGIDDRTAIRYATIARQPRETPAGQHDPSGSREPKGQNPPWTVKDLGFIPKTLQFG